MKETINILAIGDVVGRPGRTILSDKMQGLVYNYKIDFIIVNGENAAGGRFLSFETAREFFEMGVDVITSGNHIWDNRDIGQFLQEEKRILRPANYPEGVIGNGYYIKQVKGQSICTINLQGRTFMNAIDCPFRCFDKIYQEVKDEADIIVVDFHAESTSEKQALGWYADGRATAVFGTHTHVQTADERILPKGTGYITDIGMTGSFDSVIGIEKDLSIERFLKQTRVQFQVADKNQKINGLIIRASKNGNTESIERIFT